MASFFSQAAAHQRRAVPNCKQKKEVARMGLFTKDIKTMNDLFLHTLADIYYAEQQIVKNLPDMVKKSQRSSTEIGVLKQTSGDRKLM